MLTTHRTERSRPRPDEQCRNPRSRACFEATLELLRPLLKSGTGQPGAVYFRALSKLHKHYPDLPEAELEALAMAAMRELGGR